jgi:hypothetical protein
MRISDLLCVVALAGLASACDNAGVTNSSATSAMGKMRDLIGKSEPTAQPKRFACRVAGMKQWAEACTARVMPGQDGMRVMTLMGPDGGFRRITLNGKDLLEADGAEPLRINASHSDMIELAIGGNGYRVPLTLLSEHP